MTPFLLVLALTLGVLAALFCDLWRKAVNEWAWWKGLYTDKAQECNRRIWERDAAETTVHKRNVELRALEEELKTVRGQLDTAVADRDRLHTELTSLKSHLGELAA
jgi:chromosome segregation ATPase